MCFVVVFVVLKKHIDVKLNRIITAHLLTEQDFCCLIISHSFRSAGLPDMGVKFRKRNYFVNSTYLEKCALAFHVVQVTDRDVMLSYFILIKFIAFDFNQW